MPKELGTFGLGTRNNSHFVRRERWPPEKLLFNGNNIGSTSETTRGRNRLSFSCTGSRTTYTSTTVCLLTSRRRVGSCYLIFSGGAVRISCPVIKLVTSTPSSPN